MSLTPLMYVPSVVVVFIVDDILIENAIDTVGNTMSGTIEDILLIITAR